MEDLPNVGHHVWKVGGRAGGRERAGSLRVMHGPEVGTEGDDVLLREQTFVPVDDGFGALEIATCYSGVASELIGVSSAPLSVTITAARFPLSSRRWRPPAAYPVALVLFENDGDVLLRLTPAWVKSVASNEASEWIFEGKR